MQVEALFEDGDTFLIGKMPAFATHTPGHTPACMVCLMGDIAVVGDPLVMPGGGSARCDFPGGDAGTLYGSIQKVLSLPEEVRLLMYHDYGPGGREIARETTVAQQRADNIHVDSGKTREDFVKVRTERDAQLKVPTLITPSFQVNMRGGKVPKNAQGAPSRKYRSTVFGRTGGRDVMNANKISDRLSVDAQITPSEIPDLKRMGLRSILSNRPGWGKSRSAGFREDRDGRARRGEGDAAST